MKETGWFLFGQDKAYEVSQKYKEGKFILERALITEVSWCDKNQVGKMRGVWSWLLGLNNLFCSHASVFFCVFSGGQGTGAFFTIMVIVSFSAFLTSYSLLFVFCLWVSRPVRMTAPPFFSICIYLFRFWPCAVHCFESFLRLGFCLGSELSRWLCKSLKLLNWRYLFYAIFAGFIYRNYCIYLVHGVMARLHKYLQMLIYDMDLSFIYTTCF